MSSISFIPQAIFLDRDGTIIVDKHYLCQAEEVELLPGAGDALARFRRSGCQLFVVTNQSGIGRGLFGHDDFKACQARLSALLAAHGADITDARFCPHLPLDKGPACLCRKPQLGMWHSLEEEYHLDNKLCIMIGDKFEDILFAVNAGFAAAYLVMSGKGTASARQWLAGIPTGPEPEPLHIPASVLPTYQTPLRTSIFTARDLEAIAGDLPAH